MSTFDNHERHALKARSGICEEITQVWLEHTKKVTYVNTLSEYFVDGTLLCSRWKNVGNDKENRESWEIASIENDVMNWTALRRNADGTTYTATFSMKRVN